MTKARKKRTISCFQTFVISELGILLEKMAVNLCGSRNCMKIGHGFNLGIQGFRNSGIEGILSFLIYLFYPLIPQSLNS